MEKIKHAERDHALLSASSAHRWLACPASAVAAEAYPRQESEFAAEGTTAHEVAEAYTSAHILDRETDSAATERVLAAVLDADMEMIDYARGYAAYIQEQTKSADAVILLERRVDFSDWVPDGFGTCDCIVIHGDTMTVIDYKYGVGVPVSAKDNPQLRLYALGALNDYGIAYDVEHIETHIYQPRINNISTDSLTAAELLMWATKTVQPIAQKAAKGKGGYKAGSHCKFCPHAGKCRELTKTCTTYVETHGMRAAVPTLAPHEVAEVLAMEPIVTLWLKRVKDQALTTLLEGGEVPGYKAVEGKLGNRKWSDEMKVAQALRDAGFSEADYTTISILSPAGMDKAIGKKRVAELLGDLVYRAPGSPTIAPETDKRPAYTTADEFDDLDT